MQLSKSIYQLRVDETTILPNIEFNLAHRLYLHIRGLFGDLQNFIKYRR